MSKYVSFERNNVRNVCAFINKHEISLAGSDVRKYIKTIMQIILTIFKLILIYV